MTILKAAPSSSGVSVQLSRYLFLKDNLVERKTRPIVGRLATRKEKEKLGGNK